MSMLEPLAVNSFAMVAADEVHVKAAVGTTLFDASNPCAWSVWCQPSVTAGAAGVMATRVTVGGAVTVTVACANVPFDVAVALIVAVPAPAGVTVVVDPVVLPSRAIVESVVVHVNAAPGLGALEASRANATNCCV